MLPEVEALHAGDLADTLLRIRRDMLGAEALFPDLTVDVPDARRESVRNLLQYLAFRRRDERPLQDELARLGLSSLGRAESHVLASLDAVLLPLAAMAGQPIPLGGRPGIGFDEARALLSTHTAELLGPRPVGRDTRIMVTVPTEAATDPGTAPAAPRGGDGRHAHQPCPRRSGDLDGDAAPPQGCGEAQRPDLSGADGYGGPEAAHGTSRARPPSRQDPAASR